MSALRYVHKMRLRRLEDGWYNVRITTLPIRQHVRFDDGPGIPSQKFRVDSETIMAFLDELRVVEARVRLDKAAIGRETEIVLPVGTGLACSRFLADLAS